METEIKKNLKRNYIANIFDGGFFGLGLGFASFSTVIPLFVSTMTDSAVLIGLVMAVHLLGFQLPQLLMAGHVARLPQYKPLVTVLTIQERLPFLGLAVIAFLIPKIGFTAGIILSFLMLVWQGVGAGLTASPWQMMIHKVISPDYLATFFGVQGAASNLLASGGAIVAGIILDRIAYPSNYGVAFLACCGSLVISWFGLNSTREPAHIVAALQENHPSTWSRTISILKKDRNFAWLLVCRMLSQFGIMAFSFYSVYVVKNLGASEIEAGILTSVLMTVSVVMNIFLGWLADRWSRLRVLEIGFIAMLLSTLVAWLAPEFGWFYLVMALTGAANTALWTIMMALTLQFGTDEERPTYVGMANTLIAPVTILAPLFGGWLATVSGYQATFLASTLFSAFSLLAVHFLVKDPKKFKQAKFDDTSWIPEE